MMQPQARASSPLSNFRADAALDCLSDGFIAFDRQWRYLYLNPRAAHLLGQPERELLGKTYLECFPDMKGSRFHLACWKAMDEGVAAQVEEYLPGSGRWFEYRISPSADGATVLFHEISERKHAQAELENRLELLGFILDALPINVYLKDHDGRYLILNKEAARTTGLPRMEALGKTDFELFPQELARAMREADRHVLAAGQPVMQEGAAQRDGEERHILAGMQRVQLEDGPPKLLGFALDITERKNRELEARRLLNHDVATGLPNRSLLQDRLRHAVAHARRSEGLIAVLVVELDQIQAVRQQFGSKTVEKLLQAMASRVRLSLREEDTLARLGGDQFVALLENLNHEQDAARVAAKLLEHCSQPFQFEGRALALSASIGIGIYPKDGQNPETVLRDAELAMLAAKGEDGNRFRYFDTAMDAQAFESLVARQELRDALESGQITPYYQPYFDLDGGGVAGVEVLARWTHPRHGLLGPEAFLPLAEECGLLGALTGRILAQACSQHEAWRRQGIVPLRLAVNISGRQLRSGGALQAIRSALQEAGMDPASLEVEICEADLALHAQALRPPLAELAKMGVTLALDRFGSGSCGLGLLSSLPIHKLKVDRRFVAELARADADAGVAAAAIAMGRQLRLQVAASGVENEAQLDFLASHGCGQGQGYYLGAPLEAEAMQAALHSHAPGPAALRH